MKYDLCTVIIPNAGYTYDSLGGGLGGRTLVCERIFSGPVSHGRPDARVQRAINAINATPSVDIACPSGSEFSENATVAQVGANA